MACDTRLAANAHDEPILSSNLPTEVLNRLTSAVDTLKLLARFRESRSQALENSNPSNSLPRPFGRFELRRELGRGGFGVVFLAFDPHLNREIAIKLPRPDCLFTPELRQRFLNEGQAAAGLDHPNIIAVHEAGETNAVCYLASAYCPGLTLAQWLRGRTAPMACSVAARLIAELADAVDHAHSRAVLHRDLKPANVLLSGVWDSESEPVQPKVTDFGLARVPNALGGQTQTGWLLGTPTYMSPEQALGDVRQIGTHSDVYALGVMLYEILTGERPFDSENRTELLRLISMADPVPPRQLRHDLPRDLESICLKCLEKSPPQRYATARELAADLRRYLAHEPVQARRASGWDRLVKWSRRRPAMAGFGVASVVALGILATLASWHYESVRQHGVDLQAALDERNQQRMLANELAAETRSILYPQQIRLAGELGLIGHSGGMAELLDTMRPKPDDEDLREFTWRLLWRQTRNEMTLRGHRGPIREVAWSADGSTLASSSLDETIRICDPSTGRLRIIVSDFEGFAPSNLALDAKGEQLAVVLRRKGQSQRLAILDTKTGRIRAILNVPDIKDDRPTFSPDGTSVAIARNIRNHERRGAVVIWNPETDARRYYIEDLNYAGIVAFSPDGRRFAATIRQEIHGGSMDIRIVSVETGRTEILLEGHRDIVHDVGYSPDGEFIVTSGEDGTVRLWDANNGKLLQRFDSPGETNRGAYFANGTRAIVSVSEDKERNRVFIRVRESGSGNSVLPPRESKGRQDGTAIGQSVQRLAYGLNDGTVAVRAIQPRPYVARLAGHQKETWCVAFTPDGKSLVSTSDDHTAAVWDLATGTRRLTLTGHESLVTCVAVSADGRRALTGSFDSTVRIWDLATGQSTATLKHHTEPILALALSPDGTRLATGGRDNRLALWDLATGRVVAEWTDHRREITGVAFSPDGQRLICGDRDYRIVVRDIESRREIDRFESTEEVASMALDRDGRTLITGGKYGTVKLWDLKTRQVRETIGGHSDVIYCVALSPDGKTFATCGKDRSLRLWHAATGVEMYALKAQSHEVRWACFSPDGRTLAAALHDGAIVTWQCAELDEP